MTALGISLQICALTLIAVYIGLVLRDARRLLVAKYSALALFATAMLFLQLPGLPKPILVLIRFLDIFSIPLIWWAALALLEENFRPRPLHWVGLIAAAGSVLPWRLRWLGVIDQVPPSYPTWTSDLIALILFGYLAWVIIIGFKDDLVTPRRRVRIAMLAIFTLATLTATIGENFLEIGGYGSLVIPYTAAITIPAVVALIFWTTKLHPEILTFEPIQASKPPAPAIRPQDKAVHNRLLEIMQTERVWAETGLTIGALAEKVGTTEHQLRALINRGMGHRNFASFLNGFRLDYAKRMLGDIEQARLPILTIAMDAGFASLAPFNRAFKAAEGKTPSEYRAIVLSDQN
ncbi:MAG: helix-turn-helix domain-containing protein [Hyphomonadaceae bacterium]